jgi:FkbM family methyltransferase
VKEVFFQLTHRQKLTFCAHFFKALVYQYHKPLKTLLKPYLPMDGIVLEVGGHAGQLTKIFSQAVPRGHVHVFEPGSYAFAILSATQKFKSLTNVSLWKTGISSQTGQAVFHIPLKKSGSVGFGTSYIHAEGENAIDTPYLQEQIPILTLDAFVKQETLPKVSFIKVDVEGHEVGVLEGAQETLKRWSPTVLIEVQAESLERAGKTPEDIFGFFEALGYRSFLVDEPNTKLLSVHGREKGDYVFWKPTENQR